MTLPPAIRFNGPQVGVGTSPMQTSPSGSTGIHGQYHTPPGAKIGSQSYSLPTQSGLQSPNFGMTLGRAVLGLEVELSGKHNGLCRHLARLLRPLWSKHIVVLHLPTRNQPEEQVRGRGEKREREREREWGRVEGG